MKPQFHIAAKCGSCGIIYDATQGLLCPQCQGRPAWAVRQDDEPEQPPVPHTLDMYGVECDEDCSACFWLRQRYVEECNAKPEIEWLENLFALEDKRDYR